MKGRMRKRRRNASYRAMHKMESQGENGCNMERTVVIQIAEREKKKWRCGQERTSDERGKGKAWGGGHTE